MLPEDFHIDIASLPDRENLVAEIFYKKDQWAEISQELSDEMIAQFYAHPKQNPWEFPLEDALAALEEAKKRLAKLGTTKYATRVLQAADRAFARGDTNWQPTSIVDCEARANYVLWIRFEDGLEGEVDLSPQVGQGIFKAWESKVFWKSVHINPEGGTVCWGEDLDLDPYLLRETLLKSKK